MDDLDVLVSLGATQVGGVYVIYEDGANKECAYCDQGTWVIDESFRQRVADAKASGKGKTLKLPAKDA